MRPVPKLRCGFEGVKCKGIPLRYTLLTKVALQPCEDCNPYDQTPARRPNHNNFFNIPTKFQLVAEKIDIYSLQYPKDMLCVKNLDVFNSSGFVDGYREISAQYAGITLCKSYTLNPLETPGIILPKVSLGPFGFVRPVAVHTYALLNPVPKTDLLLLNMNIEDLYLRIPEVVQVKTDLLLLNLNILDLYFQITDLGANMPDVGALDGILTDIDGILTDILGLKLAIADIGGGGGGGGGASDVSYALKVSPCLTGLKISCSKTSEKTFTCLISSGNVIVLTRAVPVSAQTLGTVSCGQALNVYIYLERTDSGDWQTGVKALKSTLGGSTSATIRLKPWQKIKFLGTVRVTGNEQGCAVIINQPLCSPVDMRDSVTDTAIPTGLGIYIFTYNANSGTKSWLRVQDC